MDRKWHLAHADGREWTQDELFERYGQQFPTHVIDMAGELAIHTTNLDGSMDKVFRHPDDMVVVWDECRNIGSRYTFECSVCHHRTLAGETTTFLIDGNHPDSPPVPFRHCPHCGRKVVGYGEWDRWNDVVIPTEGDGLG